MAWNCKIQRTRDRWHRRWHRAWWGDWIPRPDEPHPVWRENPTEFYSDPYWINRQLWHRQHDAYHHIASIMGQEGILLEYGCGIAPVSWWLAPRFRRWKFILNDLSTPQRQYGADRLRAGGVCFSTDTPDFFFERPNVIVALEVFEHLPDPQDTASWLCALLEPNGHLFVNYDETVPNDENLCRDWGDTMVAFALNLSLCCDGEYKHYVNR